MVVVRPLLCVAFVASTMCGSASVAHAASNDVAPSRAPPWVEGFDLERVEALAPGVPLNFVLYGSPGAAVTLSIEGGRRLLDLPESRPGLYEGSYVLDGLDHVRADSRVVASVQRNGMVARTTLYEPLLLERNGLPWAGALAQAPGDISPARVEASPRAAPAIDSTARSLAPFPGAAAAQAPPPATPAQPRCGDCVVVETIRVVKAPPRSGWARWLGAAGGAWLGSAIEREATRAERYEVLLRFADGTALLRLYEQVPPFRTGDTISLSSPRGRMPPAPTPH